MKKIIFLLLLSLIWYSCTKDDDLSCDCEEPINAEFTISEFTYNPYFRTDVLDTLSIETDTVLDPSYVIFEANYPGATEYKWQIGTEANPRFGKKIGIVFNSQGAGNIYGTIDIQLTVSGTPNSVCFPDDDGIDSVSKSLTIVPLHESLIFGEWEGSSTEFPNEIYTITLDTFTTNTDNEIHFFQNFPNGCTDGSRLKLLYKGVIIRELSHIFCRHTADEKYVEYFRAQLKDHNTLQIEYLSATSIVNGESEYYLFTGKRK
jgi:hypothetical protein